MVTQTSHLTAKEARGLRLPALMAALDSEDSAEGVRAFQKSARLSGRAADPQPPTFVLKGKKHAAIFRAQKHP